jgi:hypothetical protein
MDGINRRNNKMHECIIEIAGVPVLIQCRFKENVDFFQDYVSEKQACFTIRATETDLKRIQSDFERADRADGILPYQRSDPYLENNAIHSLLVEGLIPYHVLLMHGSAICMDGQAYIFTASSGTGKSTHTRLWREVFSERAWMINDDKPLIRMENGRITVYGSPWDGKHHLSRNASAPLKAVIWLNRDENNSIMPMTAVDAFPIVRKQVSLPQNKELLMQVLAMEKQLLQTVDFYKLYCNMEQDAAWTAWKRCATPQP